MATIDYNSKNIIEQINGNITRNKILYKDVTKDIISKSLNIEL